METKKKKEVVKVPEVKQEKTQPEIKRVFKGDHEIVSDLFKLDVAYFAKNISFDPKRPKREDVEHCHFFRTFDSNGKKLNKSNAIGGHYHEVILSVDEDGNLVGKCSPPIRNRGSDPNYPGDDHTHEMIYRRSDQFKARRTNQEALTAYNEYMKGFSNSEK
jgi:hypothetical protein